MAQQYFVVFSGEKIFQKNVFAEFFQRKKQNPFELNKKFKTLEYVTIFDMHRKMIMSVTMELYPNAYKGKIVVAEILQFLFKNRTINHYRNAIYIYTKYCTTCRQVTLIKHSD